MAGAYDDQGRRKYLTKVESGRFVEVASGLCERDRLLCLFLYFTGVRVSEAIELNASSFDLEAKEVVIRTLKKRKKGGHRRIPLPNSFLDDIRPHLNTADRVWPICRSMAWRLVKSAMQEAEIDGIHACCKGLRHSFGVRAILNQVPITLVKTLMGHAHIETTSIYLEVRDEEQRQLLERTW